jgi:predicted dehydrogenase
MFSLAAENFEGVTGAAVCDLNEEFWTKAQEGYPCNEKIPMKERFPGAKFYSDYDKMLSEAKLDAVLVETPANIHAEFCAKALDRGIHALSDVPFADSLEDAALLWDAAGKSKAVFMAGANPNEWGFIEALYDLYKKGLLGKPYFLEAEYIHDCRDLYKATPWRGKGRMPIKYCTHSLGPLLRIVEEDLRKVSCVSTGSQLEPESKTAFHDHMTAHFTTESNVVVRLNTSFRNNARIGAHSYRVFGTEGYFERFSGRGKVTPATFFNSNKLYAAGGLTELPVDTQRTEFGAAAGLGHGGADYALCRRFFRALAGEDEPITLREGLRMTIPGTFAAESAKRGGEALTISYPWESSFKTKIG